MAFGTGGKTACKHCGHSATPHDGGRAGSLCIAPECFCPGYKRAVPRKQGRNAPGWRRSERVLHELETRDRDLGCWFWPADYGYPSINTGQGTTRVSRFVLESELERPLGENQMALHTCDEPRCYNPDHLYEGDQRQNVKDCRDRGRQSRGENHPRAKLPNAAIPAIRADTRPSHIVAQEYGVSSGLIRSVRTGARKAWMSQP